MKTTIIYGAKAPEHLDFSTLAKWAEIFNNIEYEFEDDPILTFQEWIAQELEVFQLMINGNVYDTLEEASEAFHVSGGVITPFHERSEEGIDFEVAPLPRK